MEQPIRNEAWMSKQAAEKKVNHPKSLIELQKLKVNKLMSNPEKPAHIPESKKEWKPRDAPEFVRDVMGSSAGAGSGEFHVYRHIRRREFARQTYLDNMDKKQRLDFEFEEKLKESKEKAEEVTAIKRAKRQRRKQKVLYYKKKMKKEGQGEKEEGKDSESDEKCEKDEQKDDDAEEQSFVMGGR